MKTPDQVVLCPGCYGYGQVTDKRYVTVEGSHGRESLEEEFFRRTCTRCEGSGRVIQWTEDKPYKDKA
jgi:DnaJ-class molecular chaperone